MNLTLLWLYRPTLRLGILALCILVTLTSCNPENPTGAVTNPNNPHNIVSATVTADATNGAITATWSDADGSGPGAPNTSQLKMTLATNTDYIVCLQNCVMMSVINYNSSGGQEDFNSNNYIALMARNEGNFVVYLSDPSGVLANSAYIDSSFLQIASQIKFAFPGLYTSLTPVKKSAVGRNMTWKTASTAKSGTVTLTIVRRPNRDALVNSGDNTLPPPNPVSGIIDLVLPIQVTVQ